MEIRLVSVDGNVAVSWSQTESGFGKIVPTFVVHGRPKSVRVNDALPIQKAEKVVLTGQRLHVDVIRVR